MSNDEGPAKPMFGHVVKTNRINTSVKKHVPPVEVKILLEQ